MSDIHNLSNDEIIRMSIEKGSCAEGLHITRTGGYDLKTYWEDLPKLENMVWLVNRMNIDEKELIRVYLVCLSIFKRYYDEEMLETSLSAISNFVNSGSGISLVKNKYSSVLLMIQNDTNIEKEKIKAYKYNFIDNKNEYDIDILETKKLIACLFLYYRDRLNDRSKDRVDKEVSLILQAFVKKTCKKIWENE